MVWFVEDWLTPLVTCVAVAVLAFVIPFGAAPRVMRVVAGLALLLGLAAPAVDYAVTTPRERLTASVFTLADHVVAGDGEAAAGLMTEGELRPIVRRIAERVDVHEDLDVFAVETELLPGGEVGVTHFRANGTITVRGGTLGEFSDRRPTRWRLEWQREADGVWRVRGVTMLDPVSGREIDLWRRV